jgi:chemotaxis protein methyltransferase CheR
MKRLRVLAIPDFDSYIRFISTEQGRDELGPMIDVMTTNKTSFFREPEHFAFLKEKVLPELNGGRIRLWTAACSSGEEAYSLAMLIRDELPGIEKRDMRILATDISKRMLEKARSAVYPEDALESLPAGYLQKYFTPLRHGTARLHRVTESVRTMVLPAWLNLMDAWPMKGPFQVIFCRNVMIYFDRPTQQRLIQRFFELIEPGGYLFVGHSEGLSAISHQFRYIRPAVYRK